MKPAAGRPSRTRAMLTVNSLVPARNSFVPSSGSTSAKLAPGGIDAGWIFVSSETIGNPGRICDRPLAITASDASSAAVTGEESDLSRVASPEGLIARMTAAAWDARAASASARWASTAGANGCSRIDSLNLLFSLAGRQPTVYHTAPVRGTCALSRSDTKYTMLAWLDLKFLTCLLNYGPDPQTRRSRKRAL